LHPEKGAMVLEMNAQPGLSIQLANGAGLRKRLDRVEELEVRDTEHGVKIAKALFAARFADRVKAEEGVITLNTVEKISVYKYNSKEKIELPAKIDTGAYSSSIDKTLAKDLGLLSKDNILWKDGSEYRSALGLQTRPVVGFKFILGGRKIKTTASIADRSKMKKMVLIGRKDLTGFLINPELNKEE
jgi:hypothetical protein